MTGYVPPVIPTVPKINGEVEGDYQAGETESVEKGQNIALSRGQAVSTTVSNEISLTLNNPIGASAYTYKVQSTNGSEVNASFEYLENGRLVISGNNIKITAGNGQNDDIILLGNNNDVSTGDGDDIVRVGLVVDSSSFQGQSTGNKINTGAGNDHITIGSKGNTIIDPNANTTVWYLTGNVANNTNKTNLAGSSNAYYHGAGDFTNSISGTLGVEGYASQGNSNDCRLYSLINSIAKNTNNGDLSDYVTITKNGNNFNVKFDNYNGSGVDNVTISKSEVENYKGVSGDTTTVLIDLAINKLMAQNKDDSDLQSSLTTSENAFSRAQYRTVSTYLFGNDNFAMYGSGINGNKANALSKLVNIWNDYKNNNGVTNVIVSFNSNNDKLGIVSGHAYSVKNVSANNYVELVNPWNDADVLKLDWATFSDYFGTVSTFGSDKYNTPGIYTNVDSIAMMTDGSETVTSVSMNATSAEQDNWDYYFNMHQEITKAGGYEIVPDDMRNNNTYLSNLINSGFAYMKEFDNVKDIWHDTSVSTNTSLQEVQDETLLKKAEAKYEADMKRIDLKDRKYDTDLAALDTERNAIKQELDTLKTVAKDNVERTFKLFS